MKSKTAWTGQSQQAAAAKSNDRSNCYEYNTTVVSSRQDDQFIVMGVTIHIFKGGRK